MVAFPIFYFRLRVFQFLQYVKISQADDAAQDENDLYGDTERIVQAERVGEEKGYFEFGGSTIVLLLQKERSAIRDDLLANTAAGYETQLRLGDMIGTSVRYMQVHDLS